MSSLSRELVILVLQFLEEEKFNESARRLEQESGLFFNMNYFEEKGRAGEWDEVEKYLSGFTKYDDNIYSRKIFFEIKKQKYLEALDRKDNTKAIEILVNDLKLFSEFNEDLYKNIAQLLTLNNFRENAKLSWYTDTKSACHKLVIELKRIIEANPVLREKIVFPTLEASRLRILIDQSKNWQHQLCNNPRQSPEFKTLFTDHSCPHPPPHGALPPAPVSLPGAAVQNPSAYPSLIAHGPFPARPAASNASALPGWMENVVTATSLPVPANHVPILKRPFTPATTIGMVEYPIAEHTQLAKRSRPTPPVQEGIYPVARQQASSSKEDLPLTVAFPLHLGSTVTTMDFHPSNHTLLLVGSHNGDISLWDVGMRGKLVTKPFKIWDMKSCSFPFQAAIAKEAPFSVSQVRWSPDGMYLGAAFVNHLVHLYEYAGPNELRHHLEVDAHSGGVNDLAFTHQNNQLCIITCGDDKLIKVWDLTGRKLFNFVGHEAPVYSICPHQRNNIQYIISTSVHGKIKAWLYNNEGAKVDYDAPGNCCTTMLYSADFSRLFSCGTGGKEGDIFLLEWNESLGTIKRTYTGFRKKSKGVVQFDTAQNRYLAMGDDSQIKFWDMDNVNVLACTDADGDLPSLPRLRFNKEGNLLAVSTANSGIKLLANAAGLKLLRSVENSGLGALRSHIDAATIKASGSSVTNVDTSSPVRPSPIPTGVDLLTRNMEKPRTLDDVNDKMPWKLTEVVDPVHCQMITIPESTDAASKVARLLYTKSGVSLLALGSNGVQKLWKWHRNEQNPCGKATANHVPCHWQPHTDLMKNDVSTVNHGEAVPCIALSKNGSYVVSATGGKISLFNIATFKVMTTFMAPPPASTFLAFYPQDNNIIAIGLADSTIQIYNIRKHEVISKLEGHQKRITGLSFSKSLNILVSSGADAQLCVWSIESWEKKKSVPIQLPSGKVYTGDTGVQFHSDLVRLLVFNERQLAIYDASGMDRLCQWVPLVVLSALISSATYSCNSLLVYASFRDGNIGVFDADTLKIRCRVAPSAYLSSSGLSMNQMVYPRVIASHPQDPNQFAIGLSDGSVKVIEPPEAEGKWGVAQPA